MHYFASQLRGEQETQHSLRAAQYRIKRKARREEEEDDDDEPPASPDLEVNTRASSRANSHASFASSEIVQLRVAGLLPEDEYLVPSAPFPHAPARESKGHYRSTKVEEEMAKTPSRLYAVHATSKGKSDDGQKDASALKKTHLSILSTVMHRCLLEGDYMRAGKAWGMILRTQVAGGHPVDPRNHGRWGIGAELLLHQNHSHVAAQNERTQDMFSDRGFELAREYYERLIVQHPNRRTHPHTIDERSFYPAMFSLWILETCEKTRRATKNVQDEAAQSRSARSMSVDSLLGDDSSDLHAKVNAIQVEELARAMEIAERLDQLIISPPFDKEASLFQLRGNISLWISDLIIGNDAADEDWNIDREVGDGEGNADIGTVMLTRLTNGHRELQQAQGFFLRAAANGAQGHASTLTSIDIKVRELSRRSEKLRARLQDDFDSLHT
ncbi:Nn.00g021780.m01.CDS01 [Neocucurbitaria sp. VM-36]